MSQKSEIKIGLLGFGTVGQGVWKNIENNRAALEARLGVHLNLVKAGVRSLGKKRSVEIDPSLLTDDLDSIVDDPEIDIVCELMGGTDQARDLTMRALTSGKAVVSANKALICDHGDELFAASREHNAPFFFEASVAGGIPVIKALQEGLVANRFKLIFGILNGTSNYILTRMAREGISFEETLGAARDLGYVEADEGLDLDGIDAAHKAVILAFLAHGRWIKLSETVVEGIRKVTSVDMDVASRLGYKIKLLGIISRDFKTDKIWLRVVPCLIPKGEVMADVDDVFNGVSITGDVVGTTMLIGRGAGQDATSSSVIGDIADAVIALRRKSEALDAQDDVGGELAEQVSLAEPESIESSFYCRLNVQDRVGTLSEVTQALAKQGISIASVRQSEASGEPCTTLVLTTHRTNEKAMSDAVKALEALPAVDGEPTTFRIFKPSDFQ
ncbi:MAG: homoserine dehydrogenase [Opitutales bacterium]